jgi:photosynthetic reaction center M subunit
MGMDMTGENILGGRTKKAGFSTLAGWLGNAQLGPIYLGLGGDREPCHGLAWFNIVGFNMLARSTGRSRSSSGSCSGWRWSRRVRNTG